MIKKVGKLLVLLAVICAVAFVVVNVSAPNLDAGARFGTDNSVTIGGVTYFDCSGEPRNCVVVWPK
ncbi:MAG: hypothetical protein KAW12_12745 [Candidatus Aminicenantes bacterium]|nr:hypothetical protein [Candidatus Aminicenantes bacterium]